MRAAFGGPFALDERMRADHAYLSAADQCCWLAEYRPGRGYRAGPVNQLILNLKCPPSIAAMDARRRLYKRRAIEEIGQALRGALSRSSVGSATWIPIPPSRAARDADYDDRLSRILQAAFGDYDLDLRPALYQSEGTASDHAGARRLTVDALYRVIGLERELLARRPLRERVVLFDDLLTSGKHYKCCERRLQEVLADVPISGLFVARRVLPWRWRCPSPPDQAGSARAPAPR